MADSNNRRINKLQTVKKIETAEEKSANRTESIRPKICNILRNMGCQL